MDAATAWVKAIQISGEERDRQERRRAGGRKDGGNGWIRWVKGHRGGGNTTIIIFSLVLFASINDSTFFSPNCYMYVPLNPTHDIRSSSQFLLPPPSPPSPPPPPLSPPLPPVSLSSSPLS